MPYGTLEVDYSIENSKVLIPFLKVKGDWKVAASPLLRPIFPQPHTNIILSDWICSTHLEGLETLSLGIPVHLHSPHYMGFKLFNLLIINTVFALGKEGMFVL